MTARHDLIVDAADRMFAAIARGDIEWVIAATRDRRYEVLDREVFDNGPSEGLSGSRGGGFVQQHILHATTRTGETVALRVCLVVKMGQDGLIRRIDEYLDPAELAALLS